MLAKNKMLAEGNTFLVENKQLAKCLQKCKSSNMLLKKKHNTNLSKMLIKGNKTYAKNESNKVNYNTAVPLIKSSQVLQKPVNHPLIELRCVTQLMEKLVFFCTGGFGADEKFCFVTVGGEPGSAVIQAGRVFRWVSLCNNEIRWDFGRSSQPEGGRW